MALINLGGNIDARSTTNWTPLHLAILNDHESLALLLLERRANIFQRDVRVSSSELID
jgi:ankyrin repeat protein